MEGLRATQSPAAAAILAVLDDDDLLCEVLLLVAFPTSLVRAALVCKRWLRLAAAPAFLCRFRALHPPRLLGFYVATTPTNTQRFVPIPQPPELDNIVSRGSFCLNTLGCDVVCCNGLLLLTFYARNQAPVRILRCPLYPGRYTTILPPVPDTSIHDSFTYDIVDSEILPNVIGDGLTYFYFAIVSKKHKTVVDVYMLQDNAWAIYSSAVSEIPEIVLLESTLIGGDKIYSMACVNKTCKLFLLELKSSALSLVNFPEEVNFLTVRLSLANDSGVHLAHVKDFQIRIWLYRMDNNGVASWTRVNTICLREMCANNTIPSRVFEFDDDFIRIYAVGQNCEFVLLEKDDGVYMFDLNLKEAKKVYEAPEDEHVYGVSPFMMVWPPKFPAAIMEESDPKE
jgi:hypothetical protein